MPASQPVVQYASPSGVSRQRFFELVGRDPVVIPGVAIDSLTAEEKRLIERVAKIDATSSSTELMLRRRESRFVGRIAVRDVVVTAPPPLEPQDFITLLFYSTSSNLSRFLERTPAPVVVQRHAHDDRFLVLMAFLYIRATQALLQRHIAQAYVERVERSRLLRGRSLFGRDFGIHPASGRTSRFYEKDTDNLLNRLVLAGLVVAHDLLRESPWRTLARTQLFTWRTLASEVPVRIEEYATGSSKLSRLTQQYAGVLELSRSLVFGFSARDLTESRGVFQQALDFDMAYLFERFVGRLLDEAIREKSGRAALQLRDVGALLDGYGGSYTWVRPDVTILVEDRPAVIVDAKYKARYVTRSDGSSGSRVLSSDIYQMFFYQARARVRHSLAAPVPGWILAPKLDPEALEPTEEERSIYWKEEDVATPYKLRVIPLPLRPMIRAVQAGASPWQVLEEAPELRKELLAVLK